MIKHIIRRFFANLLYPVESKDWYKTKGYLETDDTGEQFNDFLNKQKIKGAIYREEFKSLKITRKSIPSNQATLDSVFLTPNKKISQNKPGNGLYFIMFQGRGEYYESRFRDMARLAKYTGASVIGFNPKGFNSSSGFTSKLSDIVEDGVNVVHFLLNHQIKPWQIIFFGNSLGSAVQEMVKEYFLNNYKMNFRQINSNSFKSLSATITQKYKIAWLEKFCFKIMHWVGWEIIVGPKFFITNPYRCYLRRKNDRTILPSAEYHYMVNPALDYENSPDIYKEANKWLNQNCTLIYKDSSISKDPHIMSLHHFVIEELNEMGENKSVYDFINYYLSASNEFLNINNEIE